MRRLAQCALVAVLGVGAAGRLSAQVLGIPYYVNPKGGSGLMVAANVGRATSDSAGTSFKGTGLAVTGGIGAGPLYITASAGTFSPSNNAIGSISTFGGTAGLQVFGGPLVPVSIGVQAGVGYWKSNGITQVNIPVAVGVGLNVPLFPLKPWIAPRFERFQYSGTGSPSAVNRIGVSVGTDFSLLLGLGLHAAVDYMPKTTANGTTYGSQTTIGVGAHFRFSPPMM